MFTYPEFLIEAQKSFSGKKKDGVDFYKSGVYATKTNTSPEYLEAIEGISQYVGEYFDEHPPSAGELLTNFSGVFKLNGLDVIANSIIPDLEENLFGCHLFVDKIYSYRSHLGERRASWLWHWDNNPDEVVKIIIYLSDVNDDEDGPFEYLRNPETGLAPIIETSRSGYNHWKKPRNNSRITDQEMKSFANQGYVPYTVHGLKGTATIFNNNCAHRANPPADGKYRDVITLRVRPTIKPVTYISPKWTTTCEVTGAVPRDPAQRRQK